MRDTYFIYRDLFGTAEMRAVWCEENLVQRWLDVEAAIARVQGRLGWVPADLAEQIVARCNVRDCRPDRIGEHFKQTGHVIVSLMRTFKETAGEAGEYFHYGTTTQDILDTGLTLQLRDGYSVLFPMLRDLESSLCELAETHAATPMSGRSEGQVALPVTYGFKVAILAMEIRDHMERLKEASRRLFTASITGATGTAASYVYLAGDEAGADRFRSEVAAELGLDHPLIDQHHRTDRFAEVATVLASLCSTLGEAGLEIRDLQRTEVDEVREPWDPAVNYSSSTLPQKRNPEMSEWLEGLAKVARGNAMAAMDVQQQHERDISRLPVQLSAIPECFLLASASVDIALRIYRGLEVRSERMLANLQRDESIVAEAAMLALGRKSGKKLWAHGTVHEVAVRAKAEGVPFAQALLAEPKVTEWLTPDEIRRAMDPASYVGTAPAQAMAVVAKIGSLRETDPAWLISRSGQR